VFASATASQRPRRLGHQSVSGGVRVQRVAARR